LIGIGSAAGMEIGSTGRDISIQMCFGDGAKPGIDGASASGRFLPLKRRVGAARAPPGAWTEAVEPRSAAERASQNDVTVTAKHDLKM